MSVLKGWKYVAFISAFVGSIGLATYPIIIYPMTHVEEYKKAQEINRSQLDQARVLPSSMNVWTDPFERKND
ncbi:small integral membrane protein 20 [Daktulosphaira vitifoliae]|uniref:small integral membrane protein 20 n=1 Tax=Daktulosphaira vitifoliae TaxID=58002 RepID=UPI0021AA96DE|nr:small integral membrane protein 20 [Daktulosphaira vitifoliae]